MQKTGDSVQERIGTVEDALTAINQRPWALQIRKLPDGTCHVTGGRSEPRVVYSGTEEACQALVYGMALAYLTDLPETRAT
jgi:hypothetical protein